MLYHVVFPKYDIKINYESFDTDFVLASALSKESSWFREGTDYRKGIRNNGAVQRIRNTVGSKNVSKEFRDKEMNEESKKMSEKSRKGDKEKMEWGIENGRDRDRERERETRD